MENIIELKKVEKNRYAVTGYLTHKKDVRISSHLQDVTCAGIYSNRIFDNFIISAIREKEAELIERAFELEEAHYQKIKKLAKIEAVNIIAEEELI